MQVYGEEKANYYKSKNNEVGNGATALHAAGQVQEAVDELLELFRRDREWNDAAAKTQLFTIFDALKPQDPIALSGRRKLSSLIFA